MKFKNIKVGWAVKIGDREEIHMSSEKYDIELKQLETFGVSAIFITNKQTKAVGGTTFNNVVYFEPLTEPEPKRTAEKPHAKAKGRDPKPWTDKDTGL